MSRLYTQAVTEAGGPTAELFDKIRKSIGKVPNAYATIGSNSPLALETVLNLDGALRKSSLNATEIEVVKLAVSQVAQCDYCLAAHTLAARGTGLGTDAILAVRRGLPSGDDRHDALAAFARSVVTTSGTVAPQVLDAIRQAGFGDGQLIEILLAITAIYFTNMFNRLNDTTLDFTRAPA
jgi:uncharacterized peroxidase-related enzyme